MGMQISNFSCSTLNLRKNNQPLQRTAFANAQDCVAFKGHLGSEKLVKNGQKLLLRNETGFFRDVQTKKFVVDYINETFADKSKIKMLVGACCTGEEALAYSMLLKHLQPKLVIIGFDISPKNIKQAQSGKFAMQHPAKPLKEGVVDLFTSISGDEYLAYETNKVLTAQELKHKQLFDEYFDILPEIHADTPSLLQRFRYWCYEKILNVQPPSFETRMVQLKPEKAGLCNFETADIFELDKVTKGEKADVITFSNAMYHLTTEDVWGVFRQTRDDRVEIITDVALKVKENLNPKGIFVLGENEVGQMMDFETLPMVFEREGFKPLNKTDKHDANVWQLIE